jgi:glycosyltransferase involved in cell wall biosynthesis
MTSCVVVTPALRYGSWSWFEDIMARAPEVSWTVIGYGAPPKHRASGVKFITIPSGNYLRIGRLASLPYLRWINFAYLLPLCVIALIVATLKRADVVVGNGIAATSLLRPCRITAGSAVWLGYHGYISHLSPFSLGALRIAISGCTGAVCNSRGSAEDIQKILQRDRVFSIDHWAEPVFFEEDPLAHERIPGRLKILFVGRTDEEKFGQCCRVAELLGSEGLASLIVVGPPALNDSNPAVSYVGYVDSRSELRKYYDWADLTWAPADVDYLSRPGVEALASGCPVIVSDIPAVSGKSDGRVRIPRSLVPSGTGWVVDGSKDSEALQLLRKLSSEENAVGDRRICREYARAKYSVQNIDEILKLWFGEIARPG